VTIKGIVKEKPQAPENQTTGAITGRGGMFGGMPGGMPGEAGDRGGMPGGMPGEAGDRGGMPGGMPDEAGREGGFPGFGGAQATPVVYIDNGKYSAEKSKTGLVTEGEFDNVFADGIKIEAEEGDIGGVYVSGLKSEYTISDANIDLSGSGAFGLAGPGSGASADDYGTLIIRNSTITTSGENRNATAVQNHGILKVYNSTLTSHGVPFEPNFTDTGQKLQLEIDGNSRTHVTLSNSYSYFYYCDVIAEGWGALSTDGAQGFVYLEANYCTVKTITAGYGTYADMGCHVVINDSDFDVANMAGIMAGDADITFNNTKAKCGTYFVLMHSIGGPEELSYLKVTGGGIVTKGPVLCVRSANADISFNGVKMTSESGLLLKSVISLDPNAAQAADTKGQEVYGIHATFKDMYAEGDIDHSEDKENREMALYLEATTLKGAIKDALISIGPRSKWIATANSNVTIIGNIDLSQIDASAGVTINAVASESGTYTLASGGTLILKAS
jgi:hypothetical protein